MCRARPAASAVASLWHRSNPRPRQAELAAPITPGTRRVTVGVLAAVCLALLAFFVSRLTVRGEIFPGVNAFAIPVGGLSERDAKARLHERATTLQGSPVAITFNGRTTTPTLGELGVAFDVEATLQSAMGYGRDHHVTSGVLRPLHLLPGSYDVPLALSFDRATFEGYLQRLNQQFGTATVNAAVAIDSGVATITPEHDGGVIASAPVAADLLRQVKAMKAPALTVVAHPQAPALRAVDLAPVKAMLDQALAQPMVLRYGEQRWTLEPADLGRLTRVHAGTAGQPPSVDLDADAVKNLGRQLATGIDRPVVNAQVDESGEYRRLVPAVPGRALQLDAFVAAVQAAFRDGRHQVDVPVGEIAPQMTTDALLANLGVTGLVAKGTSDFSGSEPGRATNVRVASGLVDGILVPPHGTFSFNHAIGAIVNVHGFVAAGATENGIPGTAVGGGVCQVSTTVFRAALKAGFPITEWWPHAYREVYYEQGGWAAGFDASIQQPDGDPMGGSDLKFANPSDGWLLVRAVIMNDTILTVTLHGTPTGYNVVIDDPQSADVVPAEGTSEEVDPNLPVGTAIKARPARDGVTITVKRHVTDRTGAVILSDVYVSTYQPRGAVYRVSPDMAGTIGSGG